MRFSHEDGNYIPNKESKKSIKQCPLERYKLSAMRRGGLMVNYPLTATVRASLTHHKNYKILKKSQKLRDMGYVAVTLYDSSTTTSIIRLRVKTT